MSSLRRGKPEVGRRLQGALVEPNLYRLVVVRRKHKVPVKARPRRHHDLLLTGAEGENMVMLARIYSSRCHRSRPPRCAAGCGAAVLGSRVVVFRYIAFLLFADPGLSLAVGISCTEFCNTLGAARTLPASMVKSVGLGNWLHKQRQKCTAGRTTTS